MADHLGSASLTTDGSGSVVSRQLYDAWGNVRTSASTGQMPTDIGYTGQRLDATGLMFYNARYYSSVLGRFISADSIVPGEENPQDLNRYTYVLNNPLRFTDPSGNYSPEAIADYCSKHPDCNVDAWKANTNWWNFLSTAITGDVLALLGKDGESFSYWQFQGFGNSTLTGVTQVTDLAGKQAVRVPALPGQNGYNPFTDDVSGLQRYFPAQNSGSTIGAPTPDIAEAGLWRFENGLLTSKYHTDPRVSIESHTITDGEVQWETGKFTARMGIFGLVLHPITGFIFGLGSNFVQNEAFPNLAEGNNSLTVDRDGIKTMFRYDPWRTGSFAKCF